MTASDPDELRASSNESWELAAAGWGRIADRIREWTAELSARMLDSLELEPGQRVLELAAGPGDTGFQAAGRIAPGGTLICSDGAEAMLDVARERAQAQGIEGVEFRQLDLEWIDLPTADVDAVLCRWGIMLVVDSEAAAREIRRVLKPGGRAALAVWDVPERNPWVEIPSGVMIELGHAQPPDLDAPGMFKLAGDGALAELLQSAGLIDVHVAPVAIDRRVDGIDQYLAQMLQTSRAFREAYEQLEFDRQLEVKRRIAIVAKPFTASDGSLTLPGSSLLATASA